MLKHLGGDSIYMFVQGSAQSCVWPDQYFTIDFTELVRPREARNSCKTAFVVVQRSMAKHMRFCGEIYIQPYT